MIRRIARPLLGSIFVYTGYTGLTTDPGRKADTVAPLVERAAEALPDSPAIPTSARSWVRINAGVQLGGGLLLATGRAPRVASLALAGTLVPATVVDHPFWAEADPEVRREQQLHFVKNLSLLGGLLIAGFDTEGKPGLTWRARRAAERASERVSETVSAITPRHHDDGNVWRERAHAAQEYGATAIGRAKPAVAGAVEKAKPAIADAAEKVKPVVDDAVDRARPVLDDVVDRARPVLADAAEAASGFVDAAGDRLHALRDEASAAVAERARSRVA
ncbi:DoxX family protein [Tsukamurella ocularis]|uniref:DoxX family protein n=1 Tax=Tsukamurella ocularis TaxID=1970234 RepID=UPI0021685791|nr:DoxX family protein [Tsukamurella ocularis]MCS3780851.1 putative membrane protein YphA (DoxX/SURF4 family) [Tsukamurella ocularis]MCS3786675.1 putative membrane protein YphA (DoxX/SURF4 family) [Tsukamurella ocularis]MCS3850517.1 putative membrane protein YphA (DoxX/SURF4 family) [Tsukamurella ocularis]